MNKMPVVQLEGVTKALAEKSLSEEQLTGRAKIIEETQ